MEEIKEIGAKIAVNEEERFWIDTKKTAEANTLSNLRMNEINEKIVELCNEKLESFK